RLVANPRLDLALLPAELAAVEHARLREFSVTHPFPNRRIRDADAIADLFPREESRRRRRSPRRQRSGGWPGVRLERRLCRARARPLLDRHKKTSSDYASGRSERNGASPTQLRLRPRTFSSSLVLSLALRAHPAGRDGPPSGSLSSALPIP